MFYPDHRAASQTIGARRFDGVAPSSSAGEDIRFCRKVRFLGKIQKLGVRNSTTYRLPNSRKSNFATEPDIMQWLQHRCRSTIALSLGALACVFVLLQSAKGTLAQDQGTANGLPVALVCEAFCSQTKIRTANARLRWTSSHLAAEAQALTDATTNQGLEMAVFKNGFEKQLYARFSSIKQDEQTPPEVVAPPPKPNERTRDPRIRAFDLRILDVKRSAERTASTAGQPQETAVRTDAIVEGLEPGLIYRWRVLIEAGGRPSFSEIATCQAPVCPADSIE